MFPRRSHPLSSFLMHAASHASKPGSSLAQAKLRVEHDDRRVQRVWPFLLRFAQAKASATNGQPPSHPCFWPKQGRTSGRGGAKETDRAR